MNEKVVLKSGRVVDIVREFYNDREARSIIFPMSVLLSSRISAPAFKTYCNLISCTDMDTFKVDCTRERLCTILGVSIGTIANHLKELTDNGLVKSIRRGLTLPNDFYMCEVPQVFVDEYYAKEAKFEELYGEQ